MSPYRTVDIVLEARAKAWPLVLRWVFVIGFGAVCGVVVAHGCSTLDAHFAESSAREAAELHGTCARACEAIGMRPIACQGVMGGWTATCGSTRTVCTVGSFTPHCERIDP